MVDGHCDPKTNPSNWIYLSYEEKKRRIMEFINSSSSDFEYVCGTELYQQYLNIGLIDKNIDKIRNKILFVYLKHVANDADVMDKLNKIRYARIVLLADEDGYDLA